MCQQGRVPFWERLLTNGTPNQTTLVGPSHLSFREPFKFKTH